MNRATVKVTVRAEIIDDDGRIVASVDRSSEMQLGPYSIPGEVTGAYRAALRNASDHADKMLVGGYGAPRRPDGTDSPPASTPIA